jgi:hypothetical protein
LIIFLRAVLFGCFQTGCFAHDYTVARVHGYTALLAPIKALACLCFFPPIAEKPKQPASRVVGDALIEGLIFGKLVLFLLTGSEETLYLQDQYKSILSLLKPSQHNCV